ncbi:hypothetical protein ACFCZ1_19640 [Streptomyces sp. NPDC056224]|uniref:hypothetical protein n=1 Tax=Streptomyces sp. NPDC056224 TaxID=3345750 RepID=UPI0035DB1DB0
MSDDAHDPPVHRREGSGRRVAAESAPCGPLVPTGTLPRTPSGETPGSADDPEGRIPAVPVRRRATGAGVVPTAAAEDPVRPGAEPLAGGPVPPEPPVRPPGALSHGVREGLGAPPVNTPPLGAAACELRLKGALATGN